MKKTAVILTFLLAVPILFAGQGLSKKYKNWNRTPEAYFLTNAEKAQWNKVQTDADAQNFILDYKTKRGPDFEKMLSERIAAADKYFSAGEIKGSETLRGKVIILFGPPSGIDAGGGNVKSTDGGDANSNMNAQGGGRSGGVSISSGGSGPLSYAAPHAQAPTFTLQYDEQAAPKPIGKPFKVELKMISNTEQESWDPKDLDAKFEAVAEASIVKSEAEKPATPPAPPPQ